MWKLCISPADMIGLKEETRMIADSSVKETTPD